MGVPAVNDAEMRGNIFACRLLSNLYIAELVWVLKVRELTSPGACTIELSGFVDRFRSKQVSYCQPLLLGWTNTLAYCRIRYVFRGQAECGKLTATLCHLTKK